MEQRCEEFFWSETGGTLGSRFGGANFGSDFVVFLSFFGLFHGQPLKLPGEFKLDLLNLKIDEFAEFLIFSCLFSGLDRS